MKKSLFDYFMYIIIFFVLGTVIYFFLIKNIFKESNDISLSFPGDNLVIGVGNSYQLNYLSNINKDIRKEISYLKSNEGIIELDNLGNIKALSEGHTIVTLNYNNVSYDTLNIYVVNESVQTSFINLPQQIMVSEDNISLLSGEEKNISYTLLPDNSNANLVKITSSDENIVKVIDNKIVAVDGGIASVTIKSINGITKSIMVNVTKKEVKVQGISIADNNINLGVGETKKIDYLINPVDATNKEVMLVSNNGNVSVSNTGEITGVTKGDSVVTVTTMDGNYRITVNVKVRTAIDDPTINAPKNGVNKGCNGSNAADKNFNSCFTISHNLSLSGIGGQDSTITMRVGETRSIRVNLPSECGRLSRWTRRSADGQSNWSSFVNQSFGGADNSGYTWIITALKTGSVTLSQTVQYDSLAPSGTCTGNVKSMVRINVNIR